MKKGENTMNSQKLIEFKGELEAIATYGNETITQKEFKDFFVDFRQSAIKYGIETPEIFKQLAREIYWKYNRF